MRKTVTRVGRRWGHCDGYRFDLVTGIVDGGEYASPGRVFATDDEWIRYRYRRALELEFRRNAVANIDRISIDCLEDVVAYWTQHPALENPPE